MAKRIERRRAWLGTALVLVAWGCGAESGEGGGASPVTEAPAGAGGTGGSPPITNAGAGATEAPDMAMMEPGDPPVAGTGSTDEMVEPPGDMMMPPDDDPAVWP